MASIQAIIAPSIGLMPKAKEHSGWSTRKEGRPSDVQPSCWSPFLPISSQPAGKFVPKVLGFRVIIEQFCNKESS